MNKLVKIFIGLTLLSLTSCWNADWTEEEREEFRTECESKTEFDVDPICFIGFEYDEIDTIRIIEKDSLDILDTLYIYPKESQSEHDKSSDKIWSSPKVSFNVNHSYEFYLDSDTPYVLDNMEMIMWAQYTMAGEGWGCEMGNFTIDGAEFEHQGNIRFVKRGYE